MDYEEQARVFDQMKRNEFPAATPAQKKPVPAGATAAMNFFTTVAIWMFVIAMLMPGVWLLWTAAKWMFGF